MRYLIHGAPTDPMRQLKESHRHLFTNLGAVITILQSPRTPTLVEYEEAIY